MDTLHNFVHVVTGVAALAAGYFGKAQIFFQVFGVIYLVVALLGFYYGDLPILGILANNFADTILHLVTGAVAIWLGFCRECV